MFLSEAYKSIAFFLSFVNIVLTFICLTSNNWKINDVEGEVVESIKRTQGLWTKCSFFPTGNWQCEDYDKFFIALPAEIIAARILTVVAFVFQVLAVFLTPFAMYCTRFPDDNLVKARLMIFASGSSLLAAVALGVGVSWFAAGVLADYQFQYTALGQSQNSNFGGVTSQGQRFIYGSAIYMGWIAMALLLVQGLVGAVSVCKTDYQSFNATREIQYQNNPGGFFTGNDYTKNQTIPGSGFNQTMESKVNTLNTSVYASKKGRRSGRNYGPKIDVSGGAYKDQALNYI